MIYFVLGLMSGLVMSAAILIALAIKVGKDHDEDE